MKFVKGISLFFVYPVIMMGIGFVIGVKTMEFFYPGEQEIIVEAREEMADIKALENEIEDKAEYPGKTAASQNVSVDISAGSANREEDVENAQTNDSEDALAVLASSETLSVDTEYVLEENDLADHSVVETVWRLPDKYVGMNREQFLEAMELYEAFPPLSEMERGFVSLEVLSFSRERVVVQMNYNYVQPSTSFYLAVKNNEIVVYLEDMKTEYINTGILLDTLPEDLQQEIMQMMWVENEESLYDFLEAYSS